MRIATAAAPPFYKNGYVVSCEDTREAVLIDPGDEVESLLRRDPRRAPARQGHPAHARAPRPRHRRRARTDVARRARVAPSRRSVSLQRGGGAGADVRSSSRNSRRRSIASTSPAFPSTSATTSSTSFTRPATALAACAWRSAAKDSTARELFVGDTLFAGSIGRTDLPGGDMPTLLHSIESVLFAFPDETLVHSGHGPDTTIGHERKTNPFLR